jgi:hypothetical protein
VPPWGQTAATQGHTHPAAPSGLAARAVRRRRAPRWLRTGARPASSRPTCWNLTRLRHLSFSCTPVRPLRVGVAGGSTQHASEVGRDRIANTSHGGDHQNNVRANAARGAQPPVAGCAMQLSRSLVAQRNGRTCQGARSEAAAVPQRLCSPSHVREASAFRHALEDLEVGVVADALPGANAVLLYTPAQQVFLVGIPVPAEAHVHAPGQAPGGSHRVDTGAMRGE